MRERETLKEHKNYLPALLLTVLFWTLWVLTILFVDPVVLADFPLRGSYFVFFLLGFLAIWFLASLLFASRRRGLLLALFLLALGYLRLWKIDSWINLILLIAVVVGYEIYSLSG